MLFMVVEKFLSVEGIGKTFAEKGRMMPDGLEYISSWIDPASNTCWQLMSAPDRSYLEEWAANWTGLMECEITPIQTSQEFWADKPFPIYATATDTPKD